MFTLKFWRRFLRLAGFFYLFFGDVAVAALSLCIAEVINTIEEKNKDL